jgi:nucleotide-binding universal stress UspA family protein
LKSQQPVSPREKPMNRDRTLRSYRRILVGYDGSENAKRALEHAVALATAQGAAVRIVVVVSTLLPVYGPTVPYYPPDCADQVIKAGECRS